MSYIDSHIAPVIGEGIFTTKDISNILGLSAPKVRHWLLEFWNNRFGSKFGGYSFGDGSNRAINFYTLIEFLVFSKLREHNISAQKIQKFHEHLSKKLETKYPFAETKLLTDRKNVWYEAFGEIIKLDGKNQLDLKRIIAPYLQKIEFDENNIAIRYFPLGKNHDIVIDPKHQFGQPTIQGTNIKAETIYSLYKGDEAKKNICTLYNISLHQVNAAIEYFDKLAA